MPALPEIVELICRLTTDGFLFTYLQAFPAEPFIVIWDAKFTINPIFTLELDTVVEYFGTKLTIHIDHIWLTVFPVIVRVVIPISFQVFDEDVWSVDLGHHKEEASNDMDVEV